SESQSGDPNWRHSSPRAEIPTSAPSAAPYSSGSAPSSASGSGAATNRSNQTQQRDRYSGRKRTQ
ncbi:MAG: hypothetical protein ACRCUY_01550, partial [Thermoguttaceae bacterium]